MDRAAQQLGYSGSDRYVDIERFDVLPQNELRFACRKAKETSGLRGIYLLRDEEGRNHIPVVFLCEAQTEEAARKIHRHIWNLNLVPFVVVETPTRIRVYQGFSYEASPTKDLAIVDASLDQRADILDRLAAFRAQAIDDGSVFKQWGHKITPKNRVDKHLLEQLKLLDWTLRKMGLPRDPSHSLIGKYVWLSYLRDRNILSAWRLSKAEVQREDIFSRNARLNAFHRLDDYLQSWLNGEIFPLHGDDRRAVKSEHLQKVAAIFAGDEANGQMALFTDLYDFSHIPIETLSVVYEQFLHHKEAEDLTSTGEESGAYYTPLCLAEFMIEELDRKVPLHDGIGVFDPACGSGIFLVQAYRRLIERKMQDEGRSLKLSELRALLKENIFGVDPDADACHVARMSLAIALLDYANPPDVSGPTSNFQLPALSENNILQKDFFDLSPSWPRTKDGQAPQWLVGNPPWVELRAAERFLDKRRKAVWDWFDANHSTFPTSGNQVAEAFVWQANVFCRAGGVVGLVIPAMTLFKHEAQRFRREVFSRLDVWCVANFANLAYVLFSGADRPAACIFYWGGKETGLENDDPIITFAPFVTEQTANLPSKPGQQLDTWNILVRTQDWRELDRSEVAKGERLTWKLAMWGSPREARLLKRLMLYPSFQNWRKEAGLILAAGPELRTGPTKGLPLAKELIGKRRVSFRGMRGQQAFFNVPANCLSAPLKEEQCYLRRGAGEGLAVCRPPHVLVNKGRRFAVYSSQFLVIPPGENGIHGGNPSLLKALALYLISSAARWHQFFVSSEWGVSTSIARLEDLEALPIPFSHQDDGAIRRLATLYDNLSGDEKQFGSNKEQLLLEAENMFIELFKLRSDEVDLIKGFFAGPYQTIKGKFPADAAHPAEREVIQEYCMRLRCELDNYLQERGVHHKITAELDEQQVCVTVEGRRTEVQIDPVVEPLNEAPTGSLRSITDRLRQRHSQHTYFEKTLYFYDSGRMFFVKPRRRIEWNARQAILDADDLIAELLVDRIEVDK